MFWLTSMHYEKGDCSFAGVFLWCLRECLDLPPCAMRKGTLVLWDGFYSPPCTTRKRTVVLQVAVDGKRVGVQGRDVSILWLAPRCWKLRKCSNFLSTLALKTSSEDKKKTEIKHLFHIKIILRLALKTSSGELEIKKIISLKKLYVKVYRNKRRTLIKV